MRTVSLVCLIAIFSLGCSSDQPAEIYDTKANPLNFPEQAVQLLEDVESEKLVTLEEISEAFADLYTSNSALLDNDQWRDIIDRLGVRLGTKANQLVKQGLEGYVRAADYFALAAFARPDDAALGEMREMFTPMMLLAPSLSDPAFWGGQSLKAKIAILQRFYAFGADGRRFADNFLAERLITPADLAAASGLTTADRAFLAVAGLREMDSDTALLKFENPRLSLVAFNFNPIDTNMYQAEFYFSIKERPESDLTLAFRLVSPEPAGESGASDRVAPYDFDPVPSSKNWMPGSMVMASRTIHYPETVKEVTFGLVDRNSNPVKFLSVEGSVERLNRLKVARDSR